MEKNKGIAACSLLFILLLLFFMGGMTGCLLLLLLLSGAFLAVVYYRMLPKTMPMALQMPAYGEKNKKITASFHLVHEGRIPIFYGKVYVKVRNLLMDEEENFTLSVDLRGEEEGIAAFDLIPKYMGAIQVAVTKMELYSFFGCLKKSRKLSLKKEILIFPKTVEIHPKISHNLCIREVGEETAPASFGFDPGIYSGIRPYQDGDSLKQIHWKLTGKTGEYMVKELGKPASMLPILYLETVVEEKNSVMIDGLLEAYISLSQFMAEERIRHELCFFDEKTKQCHFHTVEDLTQLDEILDALLHLRMREGAKGYFSAFLEESANRFSQIICVTSLSSVFLEANSPVPVTIIQEKNKRQAVNENEKNSTKSEGQEMEDNSKKKRNNRKMKNESTDYYTFAPNSIKWDLNQMIL